MPTAHQVDTAFIFNPTAQTGNAGLRWDEIRRCGEELGIGFERIDTLGDGATIDMVAQLVATRRYQTMACFGGDGTISEVIQGIMAAKERLGLSRAELPPLGVVPFGTGNNIAKSVGIPIPNPLLPQTLYKAIETIKYGADFAFDLGRIGDRYFADGLSIGVDHSILHARNVERERIRRMPLVRQFLRDYALYAYVVLKRPFPVHHVKATLRLDDRPPIEVARCASIVVNQTKVYAGSFVFEANSRANDGLLDVILFTGWREYLARFAMAAQIQPLNEKMLRKVLLRHSQNYQARRIHIELEHPLGSQIDGEEFEHRQTFDIECCENALTLKTPVG
jgi:diacylglycerol kinase (ATP)